jgi:hypothetical protein
MRNPLPFDTHAFVKRLTAAGVSEAQAEVHAETLADLVLSQLVNKEDLRLAKEELQQSIERLDTQVNHRIDMLENKIEQRFAQSDLRMTIRVGVIVATGLGIMTAILRLFPVHP